MKKSMRFGLKVGTEGVGEEEIRLKKKVNKRKRRNGEEEKQSLLLVDNWIFQT